MACAHRSSGLDGLRSSLQINIRLRWLACPPGRQAQQRVRVLPIPAGKATPWRGGLGACTACRGGCTGSLALRSRAAAVASAAKAAAVGSAMAVAVGATVSKLKRSRRVGLAADRTCWQPVQRTPRDAPRSGFRSRLGSPYVRELYWKSSTQRPVETY